MEKRNDIFEKELTKEERASLAGGLPPGRLYITPWNSKLLFGGSAQAFARLYHDVDFYREWDKDGLAELARTQKERVLRYYETGNKLAREGKGNICRWISTAMFYSKGLYLFRNYNSDLTRSGEKRIIKAQTENARVWVYSLRRKV